MHSFDNHEILLCALQKGEEKAFVYIFDCYYDGLLNYAVHDHTADRHFLQCTGLFCLADCLFHKTFLICHVFTPPVTSHSGKSSGILSVHTKTALSLLYVRL